MKAHLDCVPCFQRQALRAVRMVTDDSGKQESILREVMAALLDMDWRSSPPDLAHAVYRIIRQSSGEADPYSELKKQYNDLAMEIYSGMKEKVNASPDPLMTAVKLAVAGNVVDFGVHSKFDLKGTIVDIMNKDFRINGFESFKSQLEISEYIVYLGDNTGEIVFDKMLLEYILENFNINRVTFAVKGAPIINDATHEDAVYVGLDKLPGIDFINIDIGEPGTGYDRSSPEFRAVLEGADMVIAKGQGNFESLSEYEWIYFLLMVKCPIVAEHLNVDVGDYVLKGGLEGGKTG